MHLRGFRMPKTRELKDRLEPLREKQATKGKASYFKEGYQEGGVGLLVDALIHAVQQAAMMKSIALTKQINKETKKVVRSTWAAYFFWNNKANFLKGELLTKAGMK